MMYENTKRRDKLALARDILLVLEDNGATSPTQLMNKTALNYPMIQTFLPELEKRGLVIPTTISQKSGRIVWNLTPQGKSCLSKITEVLDILT